jgi:hypothetical protein
MRKVLGAWSLPATATVIDCTSPGTGRTRIQSCAEAPWLLVADRRYSRRAWDKMGTPTEQSAHAADVHRRSRPALPRLRRREGQSRAIRSRGWSPLGHGGGIRVGGVGQSRTREARVVGDGKRMALESSGGSDRQQRFERAAEKASKTKDGGLRYGWSSRLVVGVACRDRVLDLTK